MNGFQKGDLAMNEQERIGQFLSASSYAVVGASPRRHKYGNKVLRALIDHGREVVPVHPAVKEVEGLQAYPSLLDLPETPEAVSIITPPSVTERVVDQAIERGVKYLWMQPGAESDQAIAAAEEAGIPVIAGGACLLVLLR